jgi:hypothetical protein
MLHVPLRQKLTIAEVLGSIFSKFLLLCNRNTIGVMYLTTLRNRYNLDSKIGTACRVHHSKLFSVISFEVGPTLLCISVSQFHPILIKRR